MPNATDAQLSALLIELLALKHETEWVEFKHDYTPKEIGPYIAEYLSALANSAALHSKETAYLVWGIEDETRNVVGTKFKPRKAKQGNEKLENWLMRSLHPHVNIKIHEFLHKGKPVVLFEIPRATRAPVRFGSEAFIRIGSLKKKLKDYPTKEAELWAAFSKSSFEHGIAKPGVSPEAERASTRSWRPSSPFNSPLPNSQRSRPCSQDSPRRRCTLTGSSRRWT